MISGQRIVSAFNVFNGAVIKSLYIIIEIMSARRRKEENIIAW
jgi:hypothetical protein